MKLSQLPDGESVFLDANIFLYSAFDHPIFGEACRDFLVRVDREEVHGYCSAFVLNEVFHKLMMSEIVEKFGVQARAASSLFKQRPGIICELCDVWDEMDIINNINITILNGQTFPEFVDISKKYHLLAMDSAHLAVMRQNRLTNMATNDADFSRVAELKIWKP